MGRIALALLDHAPDVLVISEFRWATGGQILGALADHGWSHRIVREVPSRTNSVVIASRRPIRPISLREGEEVLGARLAAGEVEGLTIVGVHIPCSGPGRREFWTALVGCAERLAASEALIIGDFNTGRRLEDELGSTFTCTAFLTRLAAMGYEDAWRRLHPGRREYSWFSHRGNGFRIDHGWVSGSLAPRVRGAWYSHGEREERVSDHSALVLELDHGGAKTLDFKEIRTGCTCRADDVAVQDGP